MRETPYKAAGIYEDATRALTARRAVIESGVDERHVDMIGPDDEVIDERIEPEGARVRRTAVRTLLTGAGAGAGGAAGIAAMGVAGGVGVAMVVASPIAAGLLGASYGAAVGTLAGGAVALGVDDARFASVVKDAVADGRWTVLVHCPDAAVRDAVSAVLAAHGASTETSG